MSLRKVAGLLAAFGLVLGLIGGGVGASFFKQVTATEEISVGDFACEIVQPSDGIIAEGGQSVTYTVPKILSSEEDSAPFSFTVKNTGEIDQVLTISVAGPYGDPLANFSTIPLMPTGPVDLAPLSSQTFDTGIEWTELDNSNLGESGSFIWTVTCGEAPATPATQTIISTSVLNFGPTGWGGWSCPTGEIVSAKLAKNSDGSGTPDYPITVYLWESGASAGGFTYPNTPFGYTYTEPEEGAIAQNGGTGQSLYFVLQCTLP